MSPAAFWSATARPLRSSPNDSLRQRESAAPAQILIKQTGGEDGVRDMGLLESALAACDATFDGKELFPTKEEKAARLCTGLVSNHAFVDGNKRIGVYVMLTFLEVNGIRLNATDEELVEIGLSLAQGEMKYEELLSWILQHKI